MIISIKYIILPYLFSFTILYTLPYTIYPITYTLYPIPYTRPLWLQEVSSRVRIIQFESEFRHSVEIRVHVDYFVCIPCRFPALYPSSIVVPMSRAMVYVILFLRTPRANFYLLFTFFSSFRCRFLSSPIFYR